MDRRIISQLLLATIAAVLQGVFWLSLGGIKINLVLIVLLALAFLVRDWRDYLLLVFWSGLLIRSNDEWDWTASALILIVLLVYLIKKFLPWQPLINYLIFVVVATVGFYGLIDWHFLVDDTIIFLKELAYNTLFGGLIYLILARFYEQQQTRNKF